MRFRKARLGLCSTVIEREICEKKRRASRSQTKPATCPCTFLRRCEHAVAQRPRRRLMHR